MLSCCSSFCCCSTTFSSDCFCSRIGWDRCFFLPALSAGLGDHQFAGRFNRSIRLDKFDFCWPNGWYVMQSYFSCQVKKMTLLIFFDANRYSLHLPAYYWERMVKGLSEKDRVVEYLFKLRHLWFYDFSRAFGVRERKKFIFLREPLDRAWDLNRPLNPCFTDISYHRWSKTVLERMVKKSVFGLLHRDKCDELIFKAIYVKKPLVS